MSGAASPARIVRGEGSTPTERYLKTLCDRTFLSLWSYAGVHARGTDGLADEVCDLLVVFENDVIVFSDKDIAFKRTGNRVVDWSRWFRRAVIAGAKQLQGAERFLRSRPQLYVDGQCSQPFPLELPDRDVARFHLVLVTHGGSTACRQELGGSGSLMIRTDLRGLEAHTVPFAVGDLDPRRPFVHVLDDTSLDILMETRDTIADFTEYLMRRQRFLRSRHVFAPGEEELLATYFKCVDIHGDHDFAFPDLLPGQPVLIPHGHWQMFKYSRQRQTQLEHDRISYAWDELIERFNHSALSGEDYLTTPSLAGRERTMRFLAREPRTRRRILADSLLQLIHTTPPHLRATRVLTPYRAGEPYYAFLLLPVPEGMMHREYRELRAAFLDALLKVVKLTYPDAQDIVGIASESGLWTTPRSEDAGYLDARDWCDELQADAVECQKHLGLLTKTVTRRVHAEEFPVTSVAGELLVDTQKNPRNQPCPCGSGTKYKRCHGA